MADSRGNYIRPATRKWIGKVIKSVMIRNGIPAAQVAAKCRLHEPDVHRITVGDTDRTDWIYLCHLEELVYGLSVLGVSKDSAEWQVEGAGFIYDLTDASARQAKDMLDEFQEGTTGRYILLPDHSQRVRG